MVTTAAVEQISDAYAWLAHLYRHCDGGWVTLFSLDRRDGTQAVDWALLGDLDDLAGAVSFRAQHGCVWFGVATRKEKLPGGKRGGADDCLQVPALWLDVDVEGPNHRGGHPLPPTIEAAATLLGDFPLAPTAVTRSGGGLQGWWMLTEPLPAAEAVELLAAWGTTWAELGRRRGWHVDNVFDVARIMRLPGTWNRKQPAAPVAVTAKAAWELTYQPEDFEAHLLEAPAPPDPAPTRIPYIGPARPGDAFNAHRTGGDILTRVGFTHARRSGDEDHWTRPGKTAKDGTSATVYADGHTTVWSDTTAAAYPALELRRPYDPFGLYTVLFHGGDYTAASDELVAQGYGTKARADDDLSWLPDRITQTSSITPAGTAAAIAVQNPPPQPPADPYQAILDRAVLQERSRRHARRILDAEEAAPTGPIEPPTSDPDIYDLFDEPDPEYRWAIPGLLERCDRGVVTGPEGGGKSTLLRQIGVQAAAGIQPFTLDDMDPLKVLFVDLENTRIQTKREFRKITANVDVKMPRRHLIPVNRIDGLNLLNPLDVRWLTDRVEQNEADLVIIGPLYKLALGDPKDEEIARQVAFALDGIRLAFDVALLIEAHQPHATGGARRPTRPYGASLWMRWPEFGLGLTAGGFLNHWRGARDQRDWPSCLCRGGEWPWMTANAAQATFAALVHACRTAGALLSERELVIATSTPKTTVHRAIEANKLVWDALKAELGS